MFVRNMTIEQAKSARDSLSMLLYSQMFDWLVARINKSIQHTGKSKSFIGILVCVGMNRKRRESEEKKERRKCMEF
jgi:myosin-1